MAKWGKEVGNSWRTTRDIEDNWKSMTRIIDINNFIIFNNYIIWEK